MPSSSIEIGTIIRSYVTDTTPPKVKYWLVVGETADSVGLAAVYINSRPSPFLLRNPILSAAQFRLDPDSRGLVEHICYANCAEIKSKSAAAVKKLLIEKPNSYRGELYPEEIDAVLRLLRDCPNISLADKKQYGIIK